MIDIKLLWDAFERFIDSMYALGLYEEEEEYNNLRIFSNNCDRII
jgi:hypothetical protein